MTFENRDLVNAFALYFDATPAYTIVMNSKTQGTEMKHPKDLKFSASTLQNLYLLALHNKLTTGVDQSAIEFLAEINGFELPARKENPVQDGASRLTPEEYRLQQDALDERICIDLIKENQKIAAIKHARNNFNGRFSLKEAKDYVEGLRWKLGV